MDAKPQKSRWKMRLLLGVSLGLNLLVVGAMIGAIFGVAGGERSSSKGPRGAESAIGIYGRALDKSERREIGRAIRLGGQAEGRELRTELRLLAQEAVGVLRSDNFDPDAFRDILMRQQVLIKSRADDVQMALTDYVASMSLDARSAYADRLEAAMARGAQRGSKKKDK